MASILLPISALFSSKTKRFTVERKKGNQPQIGQVKYWIHAASLGEYEMALPLIEKLLDTHKIDDILITIFSPSGYTQAVKGPYANRLMYLPIDTLGQVKEFYRAYAPQKAIFIRYDFWYNFINEGQKQGTEFFLVNGRFRENHFFFKWFGSSYLGLLKKFKGIFTSDENSVDVLARHDVKSQFTGDTRYDRVASIAQSAKKYTEIEDFKGDRKLLMLGSSWSEEEELVKKLLKEAPENLAVIIAPHELSRSNEIAKLLLDFKPKKYSENNFSAEDQVLILDTMGMLSSMYQYADMALIGGGFSGALHNILEPAVWGCYLSYGPNTSKFPEAKAFEDEGIAYPILDQQKWISTILVLISDTEQIDLLKARAKNYTATNIGASDRIVLNLA